MNSPSDPNDEALGAELIKSRQLRDAPEHVIRRAIDIFQGRAPVPAQPSMLQRALAALSFDSAGVWLPAQGIRGSASGSRQLLFTAEGRDVDLRIMPAEGLTPDAGAEQWVIFGQLLGPDRTGRVELRCANGLFEAELDDMLEFRFDRVASGSVCIAIRLGQLLIELPPFDVPRAGMK